MFPNMKFLINDCVACTSAKIIKQSFRNFEFISISYFDLVHNYVWCLAPVTSKFRFRFFIDDKQKTKVYFFKCKSEVLVLFEYNTTIKALIFDNGEYINSQFNEFSK